MDKIKKSSLLKVFLGSFFIQSSWSFEKMQALGFAAAISPALKDIYPDPEQRTAAFKRHLAFYNAHPYMASPVLGAAISLEEKAAGGHCPAGAASSFKSRVMGPYGALGDAFFWGSIRPLASCAGVLAAVLWGAWGPIVFLIVYNAFHLWMRCTGLEKGYRLADGVAGYIKSLDLPSKGIKARYVSAALVGALGAAFAIKAFSVAAPGAVPYGPYPIAAVILSMAAVFILAVLFKKGVSAARLVYIMVIPLILYGIIGH